MNHTSIRDLTLDAAVGSAYTYSFLCSAPNVMLRSFKIPNMNEFTNYGQFIHALVNVIRTNYGFSLNNLVGESASIISLPGGGSSITSESIGRIIDLDELGLTELQELQVELWDPAAVVEHPDLLTCTASREKAAAHNLQPRPK